MEYDEYNIGASFRNAATISITYALYSQCVDNLDDYFEHEDFLDIFNFNTRQAAKILWVQHMNSLKTISEEIVMTELINS